MQNRLRVQASWARSLGTAGNSPAQPLVLYVGRNSAFGQFIGHRDEVTPRSFGRK